MAKTEDQKRDAYYLKKYGVGLDWYNARFKEQNGCCGICRRPQDQFSKRFAVDHDHGWKKVKIVVQKESSVWTPWHATALYLTGHWPASRQTKSKAVQAVRQKLKTASCRGLLCPFCNRGLRYYADDPTRLENAAIYLRTHQNA